MIKNKTVCVEMHSEDIEIDTDFLTKFLKHEDTVIAAINIIYFCILKNNKKWKSFAKKAINAFCLKKFKREFYTSRLVASGHLKYENGKFYITEEFANICKKSVKFKTKPP